VAVGARGAALEEAMVGNLVEMVGGRAALEGKAVDKGVVYEVAVAERGAALVGAMADTVEVLRVV